MGEPDVLCIPKQSVHFLNLALIYIGLCEIGFYIPGSVGLFRLQHFRKSNIINKMDQMVKSSSRYTLSYPSFSSSIRSLSKYPPTRFPGSKEIAKTTWILLSTTSRFHHQDRQGYRIDLFVWLSLS